MEVNRVLYISQEIAPYVPATPAAVFGRDLPQSVLENGVEVRTFMPRYGVINERRNQLHEVIRLSGLNIEIDNVDYPLIIKVATLLPTRMQVYFIDNDEFFDRHAAGGLETATRAQENDERAMFYARGVLETVKKLRWVPSVIHCTGWMSALVPLYLRKHYADDPVFANAKIVFSLFDDKFDGELDIRMVEKLVMEGFGVAELSAFTDGRVDYDRLMHLAMDYSDAVAVSSEGVSESLIDYARGSGKPLLAYPGSENYAEAYINFYKSL